MQRALTFISFVLLSATAATGQKAEGISKKNLANSDTSLMGNHDPGVEQANFSLLPGYEVNLFAAEPMLAKLVHMTWDARGRLWVASSWAYPQLKPGEKQNVAFAFIVGSSLPDIQTTADSALSRFKAIKTGPVPQISDQQACRGGNLLLKPNNGSFFKFYNQIPVDSSVEPLHTGGSLSVSNILSNQIIYITNADSLFESNYQTVNIGIAEIQCDFNMSSNEINLFAGTQVDLNSTSTNASQWNWTITRENGVSNEDIDFIEGTNANSENPKISLKTFGNFTVKLITKNALGCADSLSKELRAYKDLTTGFSEYLQKSTRIFPNPSNGQFFISFPDAGTPYLIHIYDNLGQLVFQKQTKNINMTNYRITIPFLSSGLYSVKIQSGNAYAVKKLIISSE